MLNGDRYAIDITVVIEWFGLTYVRRYLIAKKININLVIG
jgi:hypothetical protein